MLHILQKNKLMYNESLKVLSFDVDARKILTRYVNLISHIKEFSILQ